MIITHVICSNVDLIDEGIETALRLHQNPLRQMCSNVDLIDEGIETLKISSLISSSFCSNVDLIDEGIET